MIKICRKDYIFVRYLYPKYKLNCKIQISKETQRIRNYRFREETINKKNAKLT